MAYVEAHAELRKYVAAGFQPVNKRQWTGSEAILEGIGAETWST